MPQSPPRVVISLTGKAVCAARRVNCISGFAFCACDVFFLSTVCCSDLMFLFDVSAPSVCCGFQTCVTRIFCICMCIYFLAHDEHIQNYLSCEDALCVCRVGWCWRARARAVHAHLNQGRQGHARAEPEGACPVCVTWHVMLCVCCTMQPLRYSRV